MRISDWSSDVCSSDLRDVEGDREGELELVGRHLQHVDAALVQRLQGEGRRAEVAADLHLTGGELQDVANERGGGRLAVGAGDARSEEHTSELQSLMRISYAVFCLKKKKKQIRTTQS